MSKMKVINFYVFYCSMLVASLSGCSSLSRQSQEFYDFTDRFTGKMHKEHQLAVYCIGGSIPEKIKVIDYSFTYKGSVDIDTARVLIVTYALDLVDSINKDGRIRPYLDHYPFTIKDIVFALVFDEVKDTSLKNTYPSDVMTMNGKIFYYKNEPQEKLLVKIHTETFEEALAKIQLTNCIKSP